MIRPFEPGDGQTSAEMRVKLLPDLGLNFANAPRFVPSHLSDRGRDGN